MSKEALSRKKKKSNKKGRAKYVRTHIMEVDKKKEKYC